VIATVTIGGEARLAFFAPAVVHVSAASMESWLATRRDQFLRRNSHRSRLRAWLWDFFKLQGLQSDPLESESIPTIDIPSPSLLTVLKVALSPPFSSARYSASKS
jgi:hypothetical protein